MKAYVYPPTHGSTRPRSASKRLCRQCHAPAVYAEITQRPAASLKLDGTLHRFVEDVTVYWCADHTGILS